MLFVSLAVIVHKCKAPCHGRGANEKGSCIE